jgi:hypothetical protein
MLDQPKRGIKTLLGRLQRPTIPRRAMTTIKSNWTEESGLRALFLAFFEVQVVDIVDNLDGKVIVLR